MAKTLTLLSLCSLTNLILVLNSALVNSKGLTIRLIHPNSPESPFFQSNLSPEKRIKMLASQSNIRANYLAKTSSALMQTQIDVQVFHYIVKIGIGTFKSKPPYKEYYLEMDTGSALVWIQCEGCTKCFKQTPKPFPKENSSSFRPLLVENKPSHYECEYQDGASTHGMLARETFYLRSNTGGLAKIENLEFGCGLHNDMQYGNYKNNKIAGIMGLGWEDISLVKQLSPQIKGKFSYCLPVVSGKTPSTYLRFGDDIVHHKNSKSTPLYRKNKTSPYYVELQGISLNKTRLNISPEVFAFKNNGKSGCIIDSGTPYSRIITPAFDILKLELEKGFGLELCYQRSKPEGFNKLPDITFHLRGSQADFVMKAQAVFEVVGRFRPIRFREYFCLAMVRDNMASIIGSHQQTNHRIIHDTKNKRLVFYPEDCSKNP
ncbi:hypothetical protein Pfo_006208 [Paulownia fortunei]|nr:hypothetical protein Pfo_006208 [Paulownia fortunei]